MSVFNFKSAASTSREQSEKLLALGIKPETADMSLCYMTHDIYGKEMEPRFLGCIAEPMQCEEMQTILFSRQKFYPAWSLHRLIEMMPMLVAEDKVYHEYWDLNVTPIAVIYRNQDEPSEWIGECMGRGMYNNIIDCIEWLIKEGYFPKEYLEE